MVDNYGHSFSENTFVIYVEHLIVLLFTLPQLNRWPKNIVKSKFFFTLRQFFTFSSPDNIESNLFIFINHSFLF